MRFSATYDSTTKIISTVVCALLVVVTIATKLAVVAGLCALLLILCYLYSPRGYTIAEGSLAIDRLIGDVRFPLAGLREARAATRDDFRGAIRLFGNGGLFGYYGLFRTSKLGKCSWYLTNRRQAIVVIIDSKTVLVSPDDVDGFLAALRGAALPVTL